MKSELIIAKIKRASNRKKVFLAIDRPMMPSEVVHKIYKRPSSSYYAIVSRSISELKKLGVIRILNPKEKTGRIYILTALGKKLRNKLI